MSKMSEWDECGAYHSSCLRKYQYYGGCKSAFQVHHLMDSQCIVTRILTSTVDTPEGTFFIILCIVRCALSGMSIFNNIVH